MNKQRKSNSVLYRQIVNRPFISTLTEIQIRLLFTRSECRYLVCQCIKYCRKHSPDILLSKQQAIKFFWAPKMRQKLFLTQGKFYGAEILPSLTSLSYLCSCFICRYKVASQEMHFPAFIFIFLSVFICQINYLSSCRIVSLTINTWCLVLCAFFTEKVIPMVCNERIFHRFIFTFSPKLNSLAVCCSTLCAHMSLSYI